MMRAFHKVRSGIVVVAKLATVEAVDKHIANAPITRSNINVTARCSLCGVSGDHKHRTQ